MNTHYLFDRQFIFTASNDTDNSNLNPRRIYRCYYKAITFENYSLKELFKSVRHFIFYSY